MPDDFSDLIPPSPFEQRNMDLQLGRLEAALRAMGSPCGSIPAIQVAGTNGKGSIASFLASALQQGGVKTGLTTSPHLVSWSERIQVDGQAIAEADLRQQLIQLQEISHIHRLTPFEQLLAAALNHFDEQLVDLMVLEVGLGGRLDATTAHPYRPVIAMAAIGYDHCEYLGDSLTAIAREKAAVINPGATVISARQDPEVAAVLTDTCQKREASLHWVDPLPDDWTLGLAGGFQRSNAAVARGALGALADLGWPLEESTMRRGFAMARWTGRLQTMRWRGHRLLVDGAHNQPAAAQLARERLAWTGEERGIHWVLAIQTQKQAEAMLRALIQPNDQIWIVPVPDRPSWEQSALLRINPSWEKQMQQCTDAETALMQIEQLGPWPEPWPVIAGSLHLLGDLIGRKLLEAE